MKTRAEAKIAVLDQHIDASADIDIDETKVLPPDERIDEQALAAANLGGDHHAVTAARAGQTCFSSSSIAAARSFRCSAAASFANTAETSDKARLQRPAVEFAGRRRHQRFAWTGNHRRSHPLVENPSSGREPSARIGFVQGPDLGSLLGDCGQLLSPRERTPQPRRVPLVCGRGARASRRWPHPRCRRPCRWRQSPAASPSGAELARGGETAVVPDPAERLASTARIPEASGRVGAGGRQLAAIPG